MAGDQTSRDRLLAWASGREQRKGLRPRDAAILIICVWFLAIAIFGVAEHLVEPKTFPTVWLGMWWALESVTTVGYGDVVPAGAAGRIIASFLLLGGLAFLTVIIAMITSGFVERNRRQASAANEDRLVQRIEQLSLELKEVRAEIKGQRPTGNSSETASPAQTSQH
jgi:voltage-gated potassium channel